jgi:SRSO17 transposase
VENICSSIAYPHPAFHTKPGVGWELIQEARRAGIPFRVVVGDCIYGENLKLQSALWAADLRYVLAVRPHRGS